MKLEIAVIIHEEPKHCNLRYNEIVKIQLKDLLDLVEDTYGDLL